MIRVIHILFVLLAQIPVYITLLYNRFARLRLTESIIDNKNVTEHLRKKGALRPFNVLQSRLLTKNTELLCIYKPILKLSTPYSDTQPPFILMIMPPRLKFGW